MKYVFIDGKNGTTGLKIEERLKNKSGVKLIVLPEEDRKNPDKRKEALNSADAVFLCLPDDAAREAVSFIENNSTVVIDSSTAHRTTDGWAYGFPELGSEFKNKIADSKRIAVPGCHASGFIALIYPLIKSGIIDKSTFLSATSLTGFSGGGKKMISEYGETPINPLFVAPRAYGISQTHKHLPEMQKVCGLSVSPAFMPIVSDFYSGMEVLIALDGKTVKGGLQIIKEEYKRLYCGEVVKYAEDDENGFLSAAKLSGKDGMEVSVFGNEERILLAARYDNLGKGASGAAIECFNIAFGEKETASLIL